MSESAAGELVDRMQALREVKRKLMAGIQERLDAAESEYSELEQKLWKMMDEHKLKGARGNKASYTYNPDNKIFVIKDTAKLYAWMARNSYMHILERRLVQKSLDEIASKIRGGRVPGLERVPKPKGTLSTIKAK